MAWLIPDADDDEELEEEDDGSELEGGSGGNPGYVPKWIVECWSSSIASESCSSVASFGRRMAARMSWISLGSSSVFMISALRDGAGSVGSAI